jgi:hypothetical protein
MRSWLGLERIEGRPAGDLGPALRDILHRSAALTGSDAGA